MNIPLLLRLRDAADRFVPLAELGPDLNGTQRDLDELAAFGFGIERHPFLGAAYRSPAERLCPDQIEHALGTRCVGRRIAVWNRVASTNDLAARAASSLANDGLVVLAEEQTAGRGRRGRVWCAPPRSSLLLSVLLFPPGDLADTGWLTALGAVATAEVVAEWTGRDARIKWPNDVRVDGRKIAGILVERAAGVVIGIGLNANLTLEDFDLDLRCSATSLRILSGRTADRSELARRLIGRLDHWYAAGARSLSPAWSALSEHTGQIVRISTSTGEVGGRLSALDLKRGAVLSAPGRPDSPVALSEILSLVTEPVAGVLSSSHRPRVNR